MISTIIKLYIIAHSVSKYELCTALAMKDIVVNKIDI